jgi:CubicO group peptidase (beta-lactamase class C family)
MFNKAAEASIHGTVAPGFEEVENEFRKNFLEQDELRAACATYHRGEKVVDLWGGYRELERRAPWQEDTLVLVYSTTKGLAGMTVAVAHSRGLIDYDEKVATYWPEFAQGGKESITVRQLLSHQAGLSGLDKPLDRPTIANPDALAATIAGQKPAWEPGTRHGYHGISLGWYEGELIRRVDPQHRSLGRFFLGRDCGAARPEVLHRSSVDGAQFADRGHSRPSTLAQARKLLAPLALASRLAMPIRMRR